MARPLPVASRRKAASLTFERRSAAFLFSRRTGRAVMWHWVHTWSAVTARHTAAMWEQQSGGEEQRRSKPRKMPSLSPVAQEKNVPAADLVLESGQDVRDRQQLQEHRRKGGSLVGCGQLGGRERRGRERTQGRAEGAPAVRGRGVQLEDQRGVGRKAQRSRQRVRGHRAAPEEQHLAQQLGVQARRHRWLDGARATSRVEVRH
jgi:hypothetical protein